MPRQATWLKAPPPAVLSVCCSCSGLDLSTEAWKRCSTRGHALHSTLEIVFCVFFVRLMQLHEVYRIQREKYTRFIPFFASHPTSFCGNSPLILGELFRDTPPRSVGVDQPIRQERPETSRLFPRLLPKKCSSSISSKEFGTHRRIRGSGLSGPCYRTRAMGRDAAAQI